jgi:hypothetical protein
MTSFAQTQLVSKSLHQIFFPIKTQREEACKDGWFGEDDQKTIEPYIAQSDNGTAYGTPLAFVFMFCQRARSDLPGRFLFSDVLADLPRIVAEGLPSMLFFYPNNASIFKIPNWIHQIKFTPNIPECSKIDIKTIPVGKSAFSPPVYSNDSSLSQEDWRDLVEIMVQLSKINRFNAKLWYDAFVEAAEKDGADPSIRKILRNPDNTIMGFKTLVSPGSSIYEPITYFLPVKELDGKCIQGIIYSSKIGFQDIKTPIPQSYSYK